LPRARCEAPCILRLKAEVLGNGFRCVEDFLLDVDLLFLKANSDPEINLYRAMLKHPTGSNGKRLELYDVYSIIN
jgi:hypothetical protein